MTSNSNIIQIVIITTKTNISNNNDNNNNDDDHDICCNMCIYDYIVLSKIATYNTACYVERMCIVVSK